MDWQLFGALALVASAGCYVAWRGWRLWRGGKAGCGSGCRCPSASAPAKSEGSSTWIPAEELTLRRDR